MTPSALGIIWLGQSTFIYEFPTGLAVCVDPYLSYAASTLGVDVVVTTHDHTDHFDEHSLRPIAERAETIFIGPFSCCEHWRAMKMPTERFVRLDRGESQELAGARFSARHAEHDSGQNRDAIGVLISAGGFSVYQVGDSEYVPEVVDQANGLKPDLLAVPINGRKGNMNHREAALLTRLVQPRIAVPMHYGMFRNNTADPQDFVDACRELGVEATVVVMEPGVRFELQPAVSVLGEPLKTENRHLMTDPSGNVTRDCYVRDRASA